MNINAKAANLDEDARWVLNNKIPRGSMIFDEGFVVVLRRGGKYLKKALAECFKLLIYAFEELVSDKSSAIRKMLASHPCLPSHLQHVLAHDDFVGVREELAKSDYVCPDVPDILRYDVNCTIREIASRRTVKLIL